MSTASLPVDRRGIRRIHADPNSVLLMTCEIQKENGALVQRRCASLVRGDDGFWATSVVAFEGFATRGHGSPRFGERHRTLPQALARLGLDLAGPHPEQEAVYRQVLFIEKSDPDLPKTASGVLSGLFASEEGVALAEALESAAALPGVRTTGVAQTEIRAEAGPLKDTLLLSIEGWPGHPVVQASALVAAWMGEPVDAAGLVRADPTRQIALAAAIAQDSAGTGLDPVLNGWSGWRDGKGALPAPAVLAARLAGVLDRLERRLLSQDLPNRAGLIEMRFVRLALERSPDLPGSHFAAAHVLERQAARSADPVAPAWRALARAASEAGRAIAVGKGIRIPAQAIR